MEWALDFGAWLFLRVESGDACWIDTNNPWLLGPGDVLVAPPGISRSVRASCMALTTVQYFRFCPELLSGFLTLGERRLAERAGQSAPVKLFRSDSRMAQEFSNICHHADAHSTSSRCQLLQLALNVVLHPQAGPLPNQSAFLPASKRVQVLLRQISEVELADVSPQELAARCGCSLRHLNKLFHGFAGISLRSKQMELRLMKAQQLLAETSLRVMDIAAASGFGEHGLFSMAFKKRFGMTPTEWRRQNAAAASKNGRDDSERNGFS